MALSPVWADTAVLLALATVLAGALVMRTGVGRLALVDQWESTATAIGRTFDDATYARFQEGIDRAAPGYAVATALLRGPILSLVVAGLVVAAYRGPGHLRPSFRTSAAVVVHASTILAVRDLVTAPVTYVRESTTSPGSLGLWFPTLDAVSPLARFLGAVDVLVVWWLIVLALGVGILHRRPARRVAVAFLGLYLGVALLAAGAAAVLDTGP